MPAGRETLLPSWCDASWPLSRQAGTFPAGWELLGGSPAKLLHCQLVGRLLTSWYCTSLSRDSPGKLVKYHLFGKAGIVQASHENFLTTCYHTCLLGSSPDKLVRYQLVESCCSGKLMPNQAALAVGAAVSGQVAQKRYSCASFSFSALCCSALKLIPPGEPRGHSTGSAIA
jgi:hypothetical protein